jgi:hypothetical protein
LIFDGGNSHYNSSSRQELLTSQPSHQGNTQHDLIRLYHGCL